MTARKKGRWPLPRGWGQFTTIDMNWIMLVRFYRHTSGARVEPAGPSGWWWWPARARDGAIGFFARTRKDAFRKAVGR